MYKAVARAHELVLCVECLLVWPGGWSNAVRRMLARVAWWMARAVRRTLARVAWWVARAVRRMLARMVC
jgi:hypothetical protein